MGILEIVETLTSAYKGTLKTREEAPFQLQEFSNVGSDFRAVALKYNGEYYFMNFNGFQRMGKTKPFFWK